MRAGLMDKRITIQTATRTLDPVFGSEVLTWVTFAVVWAAINDVNSVERVNNEIRTLTRVTMIQIRYLPGLTADMRVVLPDNRILAITSIAEINRRKGWKLVCEGYSV
jgi:SPP1 family predicted phage head-tail adaptor